MKKSLYLLLVLFLAQNALAKYVDTTIGGIVFTDANSNNYYDVSSKQHLIAMSIAPAALASKKFELTANIIFNVNPALEDWDNNGTPDGDATKGFNPIALPIFNNTEYQNIKWYEQTGLVTFSGEGYIIKNLYINRPSQSNVGLFAVLYNILPPNAGVTEYNKPISNLNILKNINLVDCNITGLDNVGGLVGDGRRLLLDDCQVSGSITGNENVGGIMGKTQVCHVNTSCVNGLVLGNSNIGGVIGASFTWGSVNFTPNISKVFSCNVKAGVVGASKTGSIIGLSDFCSILSCLVSGFTSSSNSLGRLYDYDLLPIHCTFASNYFDKQLTQITDFDENGYSSTSLLYKHYNSKNIDLSYGSSALAPWIQPNKGRPYLYIQDISVDNSIVNIDGQITGQININPSADNTIAETGVRYRLTETNEAWEEIVFDGTSSIDGTLKNLQSDSTYYICAYAKDQDGNCYYGDMLKWKENQLIFNNGDSPSKYVGVPVGSFYQPEFNLFSNTGYKISEWSTTKQGDYGISYFEGDSFLVENSDYNLYTRWMLNQHTIDYLGNMGDGTMPSQSFYYAANVSLLTSTFTKDGYKLAGWNTQPNGNGEGYNKQHSFIMPDSSITLYAQWEIDGHNIAFFPNGGQGSITSILLDTGADTTLSPNAFIKLGYDFIGWNTSDDGLGLNLKDKASITMGDSDINLYAQWAANNYKISFWNSGGNGYITPLDVTYGQEYTLPTSTLNRNGYTFNSWNTDLNGFGQRYTDAGNITTGLGDMNLYAQWDEIPYSITYKGTEGSTNVNPKTYTTATPTIVLSYVIQQHKAFDGWFSDSLYTSQITQITQGSTGDITLYAKWSNEYKLVYFSNGGSGNTQIESLTVIGADYTTKENMFSRFGYEFDRWNTRPDGTGTFYNESQDIVLEDDIDFVLYAIWKPIEYSIDYIHVDDIPNPNIKIYTPATPTFLFSDLSYDGYTFNGWFCDSLLSKPIQFIPQGSIGDTSIYAHWEINYYDITYYSNGGAGNMKRQTFTYHTDTALLDEPFSKKGYRFLGWNTSPSGEDFYYANKSKIIDIEANLTLYAQWEIDEYTINYHHLQGNINLNPKKYTLYTPTSILDPLSQEGYTFKGWFLNEQYSTPIAHIEIGDTGDLNIYAHWNINDYYIHYHKNGGSGNMLSQTVPYSTDTALQTSSFDYKGYIFTHWNTEADDSGLNYSEQQGVTMNAEDITLFAQWSLNEYAINYHNLEGAANTNPKVYDVTVDRQLSSLTKKGYSFLDWYTDASLDTQINAILPGDTGTLDLYAKWSINSYSIIYEANGGLGIMPTQSMLYGSDTVISINYLERKGYNFTHWNTSKDNTGTSFSDGQRIIIDTTDLELYAQWQIITYNVNFHNLQGVSNINDTHYDVTTAKILIPLENEMYDFSGWFTDENYIIKKESITPGDTGNINLYAKWELKIFDVTISSGEYGTVTVGETVATSITKSIEYNSKLTDIKAIAKENDMLDFTGWSDGVLDNPRTLSNIISDTVITALWQTRVSIDISDTIKTYNGDKHEIRVRLSHDVLYKIQYKEESESFFSDAQPKYAGRYDIKISIIEDQFSGIEYGKLIVEPKVLNIIVSENQEKYFGEDDPDTLLYTAVGLIDGDIITGNLEREQGENPGFYATSLGSIQALTPDTDGDYSVINNNVNNYSIVLSSADFHIDSEIDIYCKWEYMLVVDNIYNEMASYQWYKDGIVIERATSQSYYNEQHTLCGTYQCQVAFIGANIKIKTEPVNYTYCEAIPRSAGLTLYPNPSVAGNRVHLSTLSNNLNNNTQKDIYTIKIYSLTGVLIKTTNTNSLDELSILTPSEKGIYNITIHCNSIYITNKTLIVK